MGHRCRHRGGCHWHGVGGYLHRIKLTNGGKRCQGRTGEGHRLDMARHVETDRGRILLTHLAKSRVGAAGPSAGGGGGLPRLRRGRTVPTGRGASRSRLWRRCRGSGPPQGGGQCVRFGFIQRKVARKPGRSRKRVRTCPPPGLAAGGCRWGRPGSGRTRLRPGSLTPLEGISPCWTCSGPRLAGWRRLRGRNRTSLGRGRNRCRCGNVRGRGGARCSHSRRCARRNGGARCGHRSRRARAQTSSTRGRHRFTPRRAGTHHGLDPQQLGKRQRIVIGKTVAPKGQDIPGFHFDGAVGLQPGPVHKGAISGATINQHHPTPRLEHKVGMAAGHRMVGDVDVILGRPPHLDARKIAVGRRLTNLKNLVDQFVGGFWGGCGCLLRRDTQKEGPRCFGRVPLKFTRQHPQPDNDWMGMVLDELLGTFTPGLLQAFTQRDHAIPKKRKVTVGQETHNSCGQ